MEPLSPTRLARTMLEWISHSYPTIREVRRSPCCLAGWTPALFAGLPGEILICDRCGRSFVPYADADPPRGE